VQEFGGLTYILFINNRVDDFEVADTVVLVLCYVASGEVCAYNVALAHHFLKRFRDFAL
jgi:hypothetical protein